MFNITLEAEGLEEVGQLLRSLEKTGGMFSAAELRGLPRADIIASKIDVGISSGSDVTNAEILEFLYDSGRKFSDVGTEGEQAIGNAAAAEYQRRIDNQIKRLKSQAKRNARREWKALGIKGKALAGVVNKASASITGFTVDEKWSRETAAAVLREAMKEYMRHVEQNIENQTAPGGVAPLSEAYRKQKLSRYGFDTIGKATGQLLENLDTVTAEKAIKLIRK